MSMLKVACADQRLCIVESTVIASGGVNETRVVFEFCPLWDGFEKTAVFYNDIKDVYHVLLNSNNECVIPWETLKNEGVLYFGVFGVKGDVRRTSDIIECRIKRGALIDETAVSDPTPDVYMEILSAYERVNANADLAKEQAANAVGTANEAVNTATGAQNFAGQVGDNLNTHISDKENPHGVTAEQVGARPNTWTPSASDVGALGYKRALTSSDDLNNITDVGIYAFSTGNTPKNCPYSNASVVIVFGSNSTTTQKIQFIFRYGVPGAGKFRVMGSGSWYEWADFGGLIEDTTYPDCYYRLDNSVIEWDSPPMVPGIEYRTTERYNGKPVYAYSVNIGALPASGLSTFHMTPTEADKVDSIIDFQVYAGNDSRRYKFPFINNSGTIVAWSRQNNTRTVQINVSEDLSTYSGYAYFKYTKK